MDNRKVNTALFMAYSALMLWLLFDHPDSQRAFHTGSR